MLELLICLCTHYCAQLSYTAQSMSNYLPEFRCCLLERRGTVQWQTVTSHYSKISMYCKNQYHSCDKHM